MSDLQSVKEPVQQRGVPKNEITKCEDQVHQAKWLREEE